MLIVGDIMQDLLNAIDRHIDIGGLNYYDVVDSLKSGETLSVIISDIDKQSLRLVVLMILCLRKITLTIKAIRNR